MKKEEERLGKVECENLKLTIAIMLIGSIMSQISNVRPGQMPCIPEKRLVEL
jgi:hypothetical protein